MITRLKKENLETVTHLKKENSELKTSAAQESKFWVGPDSKFRMTSPYSTSFFHAKEIINDILTNEKKLYAKTLITKSVFECTLEWFVAIADTMDDAPLFWENINRTSDPGNRCKLRYDEALLLILTRLKSDHTQDNLAVDFGIDQSTISRYIDFSKKVLEEILPTAKTCTS